MVTLARLSALDRKLVRDLWDMRGQALAIAAVVAAGVTMFVTYLSNFDSLDRTLRAYYERQRFADVFASAVRVPAQVRDRLAEIPGVAAVDTRVVAEVVLDVPGLAEPASGRLVSLPDERGPALDVVTLRRGSWPEAGRPDEVVVSEMFADAHGFVPGSRLAAIVNGRRRALTIVGIGLSPEFVYTIRPGELFPDNRRYGVVWMQRAALAAAFDMEGGFNDVALALTPGASVDEAIARLDRLLEPYGGRGALPRRLQISAWTIENELTQLQTFGVVTPVIFLSVAAFVLHIALTRALTLQRPQIAALKALGYGHRALAWHYVKWALVIAGLGALAGVAGGAWLGGRMAALYNEYFRFPALDYRLSWPIAAGSLAGSLVVAALGALTAVRHAVSVPPAEAMRPEPPARYGRSLAERWRPLHRLPPATRMILRAIERQPARAALSVVGLAFASAIMIVGLAFLDVMQVLIDEQFVRAMRQDVTVTLTQPAGAAETLHALRRLPGVIDAEAVRHVPVRLTSGTRQRTLALAGVGAAPRLQRIVERSGRVLDVPPSGLVLSTMLAQVLAVRPGDTVLVQVLEGRRATLTLPVAATVDDSFGLNAYASADLLARLLREAPALTTAALAVDPAQLSTLTRTLKGVPRIAGVAVRQVMLDSFATTMAEHMDLIITFNVVFAAIIAFGVVYNAARVSLSERSRELASLRVLGFTRAEVARLLLGELTAVTVASLPVGTLIGTGLGLLIMRIFTNEVYRLPFSVSAQTVAWAWLTVAVAAALSAAAVRRRLDRLDLVGVLKSRE